MDEIGTKSICEKLMRLNLARKPYVIRTYSHITDIAHFALKSKKVHLGKLVSQALNDHAMQLIRDDPGLAELVALECGLNIEIKGNYE